jgi:hypothetical protein
MVDVPRAEVFLETQDELFRHLLYTGFLLKNSYVWPLCALPDLLREHIGCSGRGAVPSLAAVAERRGGAVA